MNNKKFLIVGVIVCIIISSCISPYYADETDKNDGQPTISPGNNDFITLSASKTNVIASQPTPTSTVASTPMPPENAIELKIVEAPKGLLPPKGNEQLLISACAKVLQQDYYICDLGFFDFEGARFIKFAQSQENAYNSSHFNWSPEGTQFAYSVGPDWITSQYSLIVFNDRGETVFEPSVAYNIGTWSSDGRYFSFATCRGSFASPEYVFTQYDAHSWKAICSVSSGPGMTCAVPARPCNPQSLTPAPIFSQLEPSINSRYQAVIENYWLRILDGETGISKTYIMPEGYKIRTIKLWGN